MSVPEVFTGFLDAIDNEDRATRTREVLAWVHETYPRLEPVVKWNQPMFTDHSTFIVGFSLATTHLALAPEAKALAHFADRLDRAGYSTTSMITRIPWDEPFPYDLLADMIDYNIKDKKNVTTFWRKPTD